MTSSMTVIEAPWAQMHPPPKLEDLANRREE